MTTWKKEEKKERKGPSHIYDRKGKSPWQQEKRRRTYMCVRTEKKEREWPTHDNGEEYVTPPPIARRSSRSPKRKIILQQFSSF